MSFGFDICLGRGFWMRDALRTTREASASLGGRWQIASLWRLSAGQLTPYHRRLEDMWIPIWEPRDIDVTVELTTGSMLYLMYLPAKQVEEPTASTRCSLSMSRDEDRHGVIRSGLLLAYGMAAASYGVVDDSDCRLRLPTPGPDGERRFGPDELLRLLTSGEPLVED